MREHVLLANPPADPGSIDLARSMLCLSAIRLTTGEMNPERSPAGSATGCSPVSSSGCAWPVRGGGEERSFAIPECPFRLCAPRLRGFGSGSRRGPPTDAVSAYLAALSELDGRDAPPGGRARVPANPCGAGQDDRDRPVASRLRARPLWRSHPHRCRAPPRPRPMAASPRPAERPTLTRDEDRPCSGAERSRRDSVASRGALDADGRRWLDLEEARRAIVAAQPGRAHNSALFRQPITTLDTPLHPESGSRHSPICSTRNPMTRSRQKRSPSAPRSSPRPLPRLLRIRAPRRDDVEAARHGDPEAWYRLPIFYFSNISEMRGPGDPVWAPRGSSELDYELEVAALIDTPVATSTPIAARRRSAAT